MGVIDRYPQDIGGEEVAGKLYPLKGGMDGHGQALGQDRLADARGILDEQVPPGEERGDGEGDYLGLALDYQPDVLLQGSDLLADLVHFVLFFLDAGDGHKTLLHPIILH